MTNNGKKSGGMRNLLIGAAVLCIAAFLLGFIPQFRRASGFQDALHAREERIAQLERDVQLAKIRDTAGLLYLELTRSNYGVAAPQASALFDQLRQVAGNESYSSLRGEFEKILAQRDSVVANIAKSDPAAMVSVRDIVERLHQIASP